MVGENTSISREDLAVEKNNEGVSRFKAGDLAGAARAFNEALEFDPSLDEARENRDMAIKRLGYDPLTEDRDEEARRRERDFDVDEGGETLERLVQYALYALAGVIGLALLVRNLRDSRPHRHRTADRRGAVRLGDQVEFPLLGQVNLFSPRSAR